MSIISLHLNEPEHRHAELAILSIMKEYELACDPGCGPGLYATRFAERGAEVSSVDFSRHSIDYVVAEATRSGKSIRYLHADYLTDPPPAVFDGVALIYYDYCALSPEPRKSLLTNIQPE